MGNSHRFHSFEILNKKVKTKDFQNFVGKAKHQDEDIQTGAWKRKRLSGLINLKTDASNFLKRTVNL